MPDIFDTVSNKRTRVPQSVIRALKVEASTRIRRTAARELLSIARRLIRP